MKKKILSILSLFILITTLTGCGSNQKLAEIAKNINNCESVKSNKEYNYVIKATATKDKLIINSDFDGTKNKVEFKLEGDILKNENLSTNDLTSAILLINGVGITSGYEDGELSLNVNSFAKEMEAYTLEKEGLELKIGDEKISLKMDINKKIPLIDMDKFYLKTDDFDMIKSIKEDNEHGNQNGKSGNIGYDVFLGVEESTITIGQDKKLSDSAYKSILSALEVMYSEEVAKKFQTLYPEFKDGKTEVDAFTIDTNYIPEDQENSVFKDTKVVLVTIDNNKIKG